MNVVLMGYRGSGKTSVGRQLAEQLWKDFVDVDEQTRQRFDGRTIADVWANEGEAAWRQAEATVTATLLERHEQVIALGGGTLMIPEGREAVAQATNATRVYLHCEPEELARRLDADAATRADRPSLSAAGGGSAADLTEIRQLLAEREPIYRSFADRIFDATHTSIEETVRHVIHRCL